MPLIQIEQKVAEIDKNSMKQENEGKRTLNFYIFWPRIQSFQCPFDKNQPWKQFQKKHYDFHKILDQRQIFYNHLWFQQDVNVKYSKLTLIQQVNETVYVREMVKLSSLVKLSSWALVQLSSQIEEHWLIVFSVNEALPNCLH